MMARWLQNGRMSSRPFQSADPMDSADPEDPGVAEDIRADATSGKPWRMSRKFVSRTVPTRIAHGSTGAGAALRRTNRLCWDKTRVIPSTTSSALLTVGAVEVAQSHLGTGHWSETVVTASNGPLLM